MVLVRRGRLGSILHVARLRQSSEKHTVPISCRKVGATCLAWNGAIQCSGAAAGFGHEFCTGETACSEYTICPDSMQSHQRSAIEHLANSL